MRVAQLKARTICFLVFALGSVILVGSDSTYAAPGDRDPGFGRDGKVTTAWSGDSRAFAVVILKGGSIVVGGDVKRGPAFAFAVARYETTGGLDRRFGHRGKVSTLFSGADAGLEGLAVDRSGKIIAAGVARIGVGDYELALARYTSKGDLDPSFGSGGRVTTSLGEGKTAIANALAIAPDGKIVVAGIFRSFESEPQFLIARYRADGTLDPTFGSGGYVVTTFAPGRSVANAVALQADGKIVVAGYAYTSTGEVSFALARYTTNGSLDFSFGQRGLVETKFGVTAAADALVLQPNGKMVAAGSVANDPLNPSVQTFGLVRYNTDGNLDNTFGSGGRVTTRVNGNEGIHGLALQRDGKLMAAGQTVRGARNLFALARYRINGSLDFGFGDHGKLQTTFGGDDAEGNAVAIQNDDKVVVAGEWFHNGALRQEFALARYLDRQKVCVVPRLKGRTLRIAKRLIRRSHCALGRVKHVHKGALSRGYVVSQRPPPATRVSEHSPVQLVVNP